MIVNMPCSQHSGGVRATFRMADIENDNKCLIIKMNKK